MKQQVNYILHLNEVVFKLSNEVDFNSTHISIYNALFHIWNNAGFEEQLSINRNEVMKLSKVGSVNTYIKCLKELEQKKYLKYTPSHNPLKGSIVNLFTFDTTTDIVVSKYRTSSDTTTATLPKLLNNETIKLINDNIDLLNKNLKNWIEENTKPIDDNIKLQLFDSFWELYAKKIGRKDCKAKFMKLSIEDMQKIVEAVPRYVASTPEEKYRKHPETYLNGRHWEDEIQIPQATQPTKQIGFQYPPLPSPPVDFTQGN
jgi:hypothetical protein